MSTNSYNKKEEQLLIKLRNEGHDWEEIAYQLSFVSDSGAERTVTALKAKHRSLKKSGAVTKSGGSFSKNALGDISLHREDEKSKIFVIGAVSPMTKANRSSNRSSHEYYEPNLHQPSFGALQNFLKRNKAEFYLMPMRAHMKALQSQPFLYDPGLKKFKKNFVTDLSINRVLKVIEAHLNPQQVNPNTGLGSLTGKQNKFLFQDVDRDGRLADTFNKNRAASIIVAHPKQMMEVAPTGFETQPRVIHSTGSLTSAQYIANRIGILAAEGHQLGFLIVEIKGTKFWIRQVQCNPETGEFVSMGVRYHADGRAKRERADTIVFGDLHLGQHCETSLQNAYSMIDYFRPHHSNWNDIFSGVASTHHLDGRMIDQCMLPDRFQSVASEGAYAKKKLAEVAAVLEKYDCEGHIIPSNHEEHLKGYLNKFKFAKHRHNIPICTELAALALRGFDPVRALIDCKHDDLLQLIADPDYGSNFEWHKPNTDYIRWGVQLNEHGHNGTGGSRGSVQQHSRAFTNAITNHTHAPAIYNGVYRNGTLTEKRLGYNNGAQNWVTSHTVMYEGAHREMIMDIKGSWKLTDAPYDKIK